MNAKKYFLKWVFILIAGLIVIQAEAQKNGKIHIKIEDDQRKIDTVIVLDENVDQQKIQEIVSAITGEEMDVRMHKKGNTNFLWMADNEISDSFDFDIEFDFDSIMEEAHKNMKMNRFDMHTMSDSMFKDMHLKLDSLNSYYFSDKDFSMHWSGFDGDSNGIYVFKGDTVFTGTNNSLTVSGNKMIVKSKSGEDKDGKSFSKVIIITDDESDDIEKNDSLQDENRSNKKRSKTITIEIETDEDEAE